MTEPTNSTQKVDMLTKLFEHKVALVIGTAITLGGVAVVGAVSGVFGGNHAETSKPEIPREPVPTLSAEAVDAQQRFDEKRSSASEDVRQRLRDRDLGYGNFYPTDAGPAYKEMTPQEILTRSVALEQFIKTHHDTDAASLATRPLSQPYNNIINQLNGGNPDELSWTDPAILIGTPLQFSEGVHDGLDSHGHDTWAIADTGATKGTRAVVEFQWAQNSDGTGGEWQSVETHSKDTDPNFESDFYDLLHKS